MSHTPAPSTPPFRPRLENGEAVSQESRSTAFHFAHPSQIELLRRRPGLALEVVSHSACFSIPPPWHRGELGNTRASLLKQADYAVPHQDAAVTGEAGTG
jgi:hypothetical protein